MAAPERIRPFGGLLAMAAVGVTVGVVLFYLTSQNLPLPTWAGPVCSEGLYRNVPWGFDPLTGVPHEWTLECFDPDGGIAGSFTHPLDTRTAARRAIPVPVGFVLGAAAMGLVLLEDRRRRTDTDG